MTAAPYQRPELEEKSHPFERGKESRKDGEKAPLRSSAACDTCRLKKQKCGGQRPVCTRCRLLGQVCAWPKQKQRGPSKGYNEALEARLAETEDILHRLLSSLSTEQLSVILKEDLRPYATDNPLSNAESGMLISEEKLRKYSVLDRKTAINYWSKYPLRTAIDLHRWHEDYCGTNAVVDPVRHEVNLETLECMSGTKANHAVISDGEEESASSVNKISQAREEPKQNDQNRTAYFDTNEDGIAGDTTFTDPMQSTDGRTDLHTHLLDPIGNHRPVAQSGASCLGFSEEFQQRYLW